MGERYVVMLNEKSFLYDSHELCNDLHVVYEIVNEVEEATKYKKVKKARDLANVYGGKVYELELK